MNIKIKSHLKHINIKLSSQRKKKKLNCSLPETPRNINKYVSMVFLVLDGVPERNISSVSVETIQN